MKWKRYLRAGMLASLLATTDLPLTASDAEDFAKAAKAIQDNPGATNEEQVLKVLALGIKLGRPYETSLVVNKFLSQHFKPSARLLAAAGDNAYLAGNFYQAVGRYKAFLEQVATGDQAADVATHMLEIMVDILGSDNEAFDLISQTADSLRSPGLRRFDEWFLRIAIERGDRAALAKHLQIVLSEQQPLAVERWVIWPAVEAFFVPMRTGTEQVEILNRAKTLVKLLREAPERQARYQFYIAMCAARAGTAEEASAQDAQLKPALDAAAAYLAINPTARTLRDIATGLIGIDDRTWNTGSAAKRRFVADMVSKLKDTERDSFFAWMADERTGLRMVHRMGKAWEWEAAGASDLRFYDHTEVGNEIGWIESADAADVADSKTRLAKQAALLSEANTPYGALVRALVTGGDDLGKVFEHILSKESWHLSAQQTHVLCERIAWPTWRRLMAGGDKDKLPSDEVLHKAWLAVGPEHIAKSVLAVLEPAFVQSYLQAAMKEQPLGGKTFLDTVNGLTWVAMDDRDIKDHVAAIAKEWQNWAARTKRDAQKGNNKIPADALAHTDAIGKALKLLTSHGQVDLNSAPNTLAKQISTLVQLGIKGDEATINNALKIMRDELKGFVAAKTPGGRSALEYALTRQNGDAMVIQADMLADQLAVMKPGEHDPIAALALDAIVRGRTGWPRDIRPEQRSQAAALHAALSPVLSKQVEAGHIWSPVFDLWLSTRRGRKWIENSDADTTLMKQIIERKLLIAADWHGPYNDRQTTVAIMRLVRDDFKDLKGSFPVESAFDEDFVAEGRQLRLFDNGYWQFGKDAKRVVANAVCEFFADLKTLPFAEFGVEPAWDRRAFGEWEWRALSTADAVVRDKALTAIAASGRPDETGLGLWWSFMRPDVSKPAVCEEFFTRLNAWMDTTKTYPTRPKPPSFDAFNQARFDGKKLTGTQTDLLVRLLSQHAPSRWDRDRGAAKLGLMLIEALMAQDRRNDLIKVLPQVWLIAQSTSDRALYDALAKSASQLTEKGDDELAGAIAGFGLDLASRAMSDDVATALRAIRGKTRIAASAVIPKGENDPKYPIYLAQSKWQIGNFQAAWDACSKPNTMTLVPSMLSDLNPEFVMWLIERYTVLEQYDKAEQLARSVLFWIEGLAYDPGKEVRAQLDLKRANIAFARGDYAQASSQYKVIAEKEDYAGTQAKLLAELGMADTNRLTKKYDVAKDLLQRIARRPDSQAKAGAYYHLALVALDQADYSQAKELVDSVLQIKPDHTDAKLLRGKLNIQLRNYIEGSDIDLSDSISRTTMVPGRPFTVTLVDKNRLLVGRQSSIELRVWTDGSQDEEYLTLVMHGDSKDRFRGSLPTALGAGKPGDRQLQVLGGDKVHFDFSDNFKKLTNYTGKGNGTTLTVVTDAELYANSGNILSREEAERRRLEELIRQDLNLTTDKREAGPLSEARRATEVRPGNPINIRVVDPDRSTSVGDNTLLVKASTSSGDQVANLTLRETVPFSGVFEGALATGSRRATAFASSTADGSNPNAAISPSGDLPAWQAARAGDTRRAFWVDLNDLVNLGTMQVQQVQGSAIKRLVVQTSLNGRSFRTVGSWPDALNTADTWDGSTQVMSVPYFERQSLGTKAEKAFELVNEIDNLFEIDWRTAKDQQGKPFIPNIAAPKATILSLDWNSDLRQSWNDMSSRLRPAGHVVRLRTAIYVDELETRTIRLVPKAGAAQREETQFALRIDGVAQQPPRRGKDKTTNVQMTVELSKGVHVIEAYGFARAAQADNVAFGLEWDIKQAPYIAPIPAQAVGPKTNPAVAKQFHFTPVHIDESDSDLNITFDGLEARMVRLVLVDHDGDAPAIRKVKLNDQTGKTILPLPQDYTALAQNQVLEIAPGDRIAITYQDPTALNKDRALHEVSLRATFTNGMVSANFVETEQKGTLTNDRLVPIRRFVPGDAIAVVIADADLDTSAQADRTIFTVTTTGGRTLTVDALETGEHTGIFRGTFFPVTTEPQRPSELQLDPGDDVTVRYIDKENLDQGIAWPRMITIEQVVWREPDLRVWDAASQPLSDEELTVLRSNADGTAKKSSDAAPAVDRLSPTHRILLTIPDDDNSDTKHHFVLGGPLLVDLTWPTVAKSHESTVELYAQTSRGRDKAAKPAANTGGPATGFDPSVPGTIKLTARPSNPQIGQPPKGYFEIISPTKVAALDPLNTGRFVFSVPVKLGDLPATSLVDKTPLSGSDEDAISLFVAPGDSIHLGFRYVDDKNQERWLTRTVTMSGNAHFDVMDRHYEKEISNIDAGETIYLRVSDLLADTSSDKDNIMVTAQGPSGSPIQLTLNETLSHTGMFRVPVRLVHRDEVDAAKEPNAVPVSYGDTVTLTYQGPGGTMQRQVTINKGSDAEVQAFSKRFADPEMAVRTNFAIAEAYFEMAKKHRALAAEAEAEQKTSEAERFQSLARRGIAQGKKLLEEALRDFPDNSIRAQADYLLAELEMEYANDAKNPVEKNQHYEQAIALFSDIVATSPDSEYAPKAQYKKAMAYEKTNQLDLAMEEYVKLSYKYPDHELVADTIVRLGRYFLAKGSELDKQAEDLKEKEPVKAEEIRRQALGLFGTAGEVFSKLRERFKTNQLAAKTTVYAGMCFMRAEKWERAVGTLDVVINDLDINDPELKAQALYWRADTYMRQVQEATHKAETGKGNQKTLTAEATAAATEAFRTYKKLTWDYPETRWAKLARGRLASDPALTAASQEQ